MSNYPFVEAYEKIPSFFQAVREARTPKKFTYRYFADIGFPSSKDRDFVLALKKLGFIDEKSHPTHHYLRLKDINEFPEVLGERLQEAYDTLFETDKNAIYVSENVLSGYFSRLTGCSVEEALVYSRTLKALVRLSSLSEKKELEEKSFLQKPRDKKTASNISLNINLPTTTDEKVYESLFRHLKDLVGY